jgi:23S rRNA pseudouridine955/2504/2580 synthase
VKVLPIVYENEEILVINKPFGLAVQGGKGVTSSVDVVLSHQCGYKVYLVHRLDKDTSGLLIIAKNAKAASKWTHLIGSKDIKKEYKAFCFGTFEEKSGVFEKPVEYKGVSKNAKTIFTVLKTGVFKGSDCPISLVSLRLETGRIHQIRIHLAQNMTPIAGDDKYGNFSLNKNMRKIGSIKKLQLAAVCLMFQEDTIKIPIPPHMVKTLSLLD